MRKTYRIEHPGPNNVHTVKRVLTDNYKDFEFPCDVVFVTDEGEKKYYVEESNIGRGGLIVFDAKNTIAPPAGAIYVVVHEKSKRPVNTLVTKVFNDAFHDYLMNCEKKKVYVEVWENGKLTATCRTIEDFVSLGKEQYINMNLR